MSDVSHVDELRQLLARGEPQAPKAAQLRPLLPRIVQRINAGAPRRVIVAQLNQAGLPVTLHDLAKQLQRYRHLLRHTPAPPGTSTPQPAPGNPATPQHCSPAGLRQIRHMNIDLEALRLEGEQWRRQTSSSNKTSPAQHSQTTTHPSPAAKHHP